MLVNQAADPYNRETDECIVAHLDILGATNRIGLKIASCK